jgi:hypothetical protein
MSKIVIESELMKNQKAAAVLPAQSSFASHECSDGTSLFLAISDAGVFNVIKEQNNQSLGWLATDLCSGLSKLHQNAAIKVKTFASQQNYTDGSLYLAVVITAAGDGNTYLYVATGLSNAANAAWLSDFNEVGWQPRPYDDTNHPLSTVLITNVYLPPQQKAVSDSQLVCEVNINNSLQNYTVNLSGGNAWAQLQTAENFDTLLDAAVGKASASDFAGLYQLTSLKGSIGLNFVPLQSFFGPPTIIKMIAPDGASKIATLTVDDQNNTNLFVAASGAIYLFTPSQQQNNTGGVAILKNSIITGLQDFYAHQTANDTILWGLDQQGQVFYTRCTKGQETVPASWSVPVPILVNAERISSYISQSTGGITIFAHTSDQNITQLNQDTTNSLWQQRNILLPPPDLNTVVEYNTYTSHILLTDDNNLPLLTTPLTITSVNQCSVFINDVYHILSPAVPVSINADATGNISIVQETQSLEAVCYNIALPTVNLDVNPMSKLITTISTIKDGTQLGNIEIENSDGTTQKLIGETITDDQKNATASALQNFVQVSGKMPANGAVKKTSPAVNKSTVETFQATPATLWGISYKDGCHYHEGQASIAYLGLRVSGDSLALDNAAAPLQDIWDSIETAAGDMWNWLKHAYEDVTQFFVHVEEGIYHFFIEIGGIFYRAVITCIGDIVHAVEFVMNKIAVALEDLIKWLGFIFKWQDIVRTHKVLKTIIKTYLNQAISNLTTYEDKLAEKFNDIETFISQWAHIPADIPPGLLSSSRNGTTASASQAQGINSPQSNWGVSHTKSGASAGASGASSSLGDIEGMLKPLLDLLENEKDIFKGAFDDFKASVIDKIDELSFADLLKAVVGIIAKTLIESIENILIKSIDVLYNLAREVLDILDASIEVPVISWLYKKISGDDLSILDLVCLIAAIPATICYKIIAEETPFPANDPVTNALINAKDFATVQQICNGSHTLGFEAMAVGASPGKTVNQKLLLSGGICSVVGAIGVAVFGPLKTKMPDTKIFSLLNGASYLPYALPDVIGQIPDLQNKKWWAIINQIVTDVCIVKAMVDMCIGLKKVPSEGWNNFSPWFDFFSNIFWQVPTTAALFDSENWNTAGILSYWGGTCFDCSGILSPVLADDDEPVSWGIAVVANAVFNAAYGATSCASGVLSYKADATA